MKRLHKALLMPWTNKVNYTQIVQQVAAANLIAYWPMAEASGVVALDASGNGRNGAYTGVTLGAAGIGDGRTAASFPGSAAFNNIYSASLGGAFNGAEGTLALWFQVSGVGVWTDGALRFMATLQADGSNRVFFYKDSANNTWNLRRVAGGTNKQIAVAAAPLTWTHAAITWSEAAGQVIAYVNGVQSGATQTSIGTFTGSLASTSTLIGANSTGGSSGWSGTLAHAAVWNTPLSAAQIATLASVP